MKLSHHKEQGGDMIVILEFSLKENSELEIAEVMGYGEMSDWT